MRAMSIRSDDVARLRDRALSWANRLSLRPRVVRVQAMRNKWGSCSTGGTITLASDLAGCNSRVQDVVIVHELLHLRVRNHGKLFRTLMTVYVPYWQELNTSRRSLTVPSERSDRR
jgi:predicted metal-dependent hydrolase